MQYFQSVRRKCLRAPDPGARVNYCPSFQLTSGGISVTDFVFSQMQSAAPSSDCRLKAAETNTKPNQPKGINHDSQTDRTGNRRIHLRSFPGARRRECNGMEFNMLTGAVFNELRSRSIPTDNIDSLSLSQIAVIKSILDSDDPEGTKTQRIKTVVMGS